MKGDDIEALQRRLSFLEKKQYKTSYDHAEITALRHGIAALQIVYASPELTKQFRRQVQK